MSMIGFACGMATLSLEFAENGADINGG